jgi:hypothetical protein
VLLVMLAPSWSEAHVIRFVVEQKRPLADGMTFGTVGAYERLDGTAYFEVDPKDPLNVVIVNLGKAPRNARGMVEFSSPFVILKPVDLAKGNHKIFYAINNRGNQQVPELRTALRLSRRYIAVKDALAGSFMPFAATKEESLVFERFLLEEDAARLVKEAESGPVLAIATTAAR